MFADIPGVYYVWTGCGYIVIRLWNFKILDWKLKAIRAISIIILILPMVYPFYAIPSWYAELNPKNYKGLDGLEFLNEEYPDDYALIQWIRENIRIGLLFWKLMATATRSAAEYR